ncbi:DUF4147 domain-containing protein [bacterium]|nr:DUF4147 domain-containing protein [bacterium]
MKDRMGVVTGLVEARDRLRRDLLAAGEAAIASVHAGACVAEALSRDGNAIFVNGGRIVSRAVDRAVIVAAGKAARPMADAALAKLGDIVTEALVIAPMDDEQPAPADPRVRVMVGEHPVPGRGSLAAARAAMSMARAADEKTFLLVLLSGGASALMAAPADWLFFGEKRSLVRALLASGASISEVNAVRRRVSSVKGGRLAMAARRTSIVTLAVSDVPGDDPCDIGSGPTVFDGPPCSEAIAALIRYGLAGDFPYIREMLGRESTLEIERVVAGSPAAPSLGPFAVIATNAGARKAAADELSRRGYVVRVIDDWLDDAVADAADRLARDFDALASGEQSCALVAGGEVRIGARNAAGRGGRCTELAAHLAMRMASMPGSAVLALATDGRDGTSETGGAMAFGDTIARALSARIDVHGAIARHDTARIFTRLGDALPVRVTATNVADIVVLVRRGSGIED